MHLRLLHVKEAVEFKDSTLSTSFLTSTIFIQKKKKL